MSMTDEAEARSWWASLPRHELEQADVGVAGRPADTSADYTMVDEAFPPQEHTADILLVYSGGDTPHPWTVPETRDQPAAYRLPTWVRSNPQQVSASSDAAGFLNWLRGASVPRGSTVCLDLETAVDAAYVNAFNGELTAAGYPVMKYGSRGFIFGNPKTSGGTFVADPTGAAHMVTEGDTVATQYLFAGPFDMSVVLRSVKLWDVKGGGGGGGTPPRKEVTVNVTVPVVQQGSDDSKMQGRPVLRVQLLVNGLHSTHVAEDGVFGPATKAAVESFQHAYGLSVDGVVGPATWKALYQP